MDPRVWDNPATFDGFRFEKIRQKPGMEQKYQFVSTSIDALTFGHGSHPCPGRFFVNHEIKILLGHLLQKYDIKLPDGVKERPANIYKGLGVMTDFTVKLMIKKRG
jgi:ent-kaurene oxidase